MCDHEHNVQCDRCNLFTAAIDDIEANLLNADCSVEQKEEMEYIIANCKNSIEAWKAHLLRNVNQDSARQEILESLDEESVLLVLDWAMKFVPTKFRESQRDWFGKRGISWHITVAIRKCATGEVQMLTFVHIFQSCSQESPAVLAIFDDVLKSLKTVKPDVKNVYLKQDNAGCYHSAATMLLIQQIASKHDITLKRIDFSDPQGGKGSCDRKASLIKNHMKSYLNAGNDIETAAQMKSAIESCGGITGVHVTLCGPQPVTSIKVKWDGVSLINNVEYETKGIKVWRAYKVGSGNFLPFSKFDLNKTLPEVNEIIATHSSSFVPVKARNIKKAKVHERKKTETDNEDNSGEDEDEQDVGDTLYFCPEEGCVRSFRRHHSLEKHLDCEQHKYVIEHETLYDKAMKSYAAKLEYGASCRIYETDEDIRLDKVENAQNCLPMGWALKTTTQRRRFSEEQKKYLLDIFQSGEQTGNKADPESVSKMMRTARKMDGIRMFGKDDWLSTRQIASFFSRVAAKKKLDVVVDDDDFDEDDDGGSDEPQQREQLEADLKDLASEVMDEIGLQHPITFENFNFCKIASQSKLSKFSISMLKEICSSFQLDTSNIKGRPLKKPYITLLEDMLATCSCKL